MRNGKQQAHHIVRILNLLQQMQLFFAIGLFLVITADAFGAALLGDGFFGNLLFLVCSFFLLQIGVMYWGFYRYYRNSSYKRKMKTFLIHMTLMPVVFVAAAAGSFFFTSYPLIHRTYALAFLSLVPISHLVFRQLVANNFGDAAAR